jgi:glycosyltransferase involved in cell wall biosynthesis
MGRNDRRWRSSAIVALESFAAGTPVIGSQLAGLEDLIVPGATGWLVSAEDSVMLARALEEAWESPERCRRLGERGRRFAQNYDWKEIARRHIDLYQDLLHRKMAKAA